MSQSSFSTFLQRGAILLAALLVLGLLPWFPGVGWAWSFALGALCLLVYRDENAPQGPPDSPSARGARWRAGILATLAAAHCFQLFAIGLTALGWLVAAIWLAKGALQRAGQAGGVMARLDFGQMRRGYRFYLAAGALVCLGCLFSIWGRTPGWMSFGWTGGTQLSSVYNHTTGYYEMTTTYNPILHPNNLFFPGFEFSGRALRGALWIEIALGMLFLSAAMPPRATQKWRFWALGAWVVALMWCLPYWREGERAPRIFALALLLCGFALWKLWQGREAGDYDAADVARRFQKLRG